MNKIRIDFLKEKTDTECRELAGHYYRRARRAEKERDQLRTDFETLHSEREKLAEALEAIMEFGCNPKSNRGSWALDKAESALAAYRNQGENQ